MGHMLMSILFQSRVTYSHDPSWDTEHAKQTNKMHDGYVRRSTSNYYFFY